MTSLPMSPPGLSAALLPSLVLCGHGPCPHPTTPASPHLVHPISGPLQVGLTCKNIPAFFFLSLLSTIFIRWSKQSMAEKRENHTALFAKLNRNSNGVGYF